MEVKSLAARVEIKDADKGTVDCVFATLGVKDRDNDVTVAGAFEDGAPVVISAYGHTSWGGALPTGKGTIREVGNEAVMSGQFFMDTAHGADTFKTVKGLGTLQQWSYGYDAKEFTFGDHEGERVRFLKQLATYEVSPTLMGAGINTRTTGAKSLNGATFIGEATSVLAYVTALADRHANVMAKRGEKGKGLGTDSQQIIDQIVSQVKRFTDVPDPVPTTDELAEMFAVEYARSIARQRM
jgi:hypothetical protein